jgi:hypothetical protein
MTMDDTARLRWMILGVLVAVALVSSLVGVLLLGQTWGALLLNIGTEAAGAAVTYYLLVWLIGRRESKAALIAKMRSRVRDVAIAAAEELRDNGWLQDGSLQDVNLAYANLVGAELRGAELRGAVLFEADLREAKLVGADLRGAILVGADLRGANLNGAKVTEEQLATAKSCEGAIGPRGMERD